MSLTQRTLLVADAKNRALRSFLIGIAVDIGLAVALVLYTTFNDASQWGDLEWYTLSFLLVKSVMISGASYVLRRFIDGSSFPTPLPPSPQVEPTEQVDGEGENGPGPDDTGFVGQDPL